MNLKNSETYKNLARAYAGECMARTRYEFMEYGARNEGHKTIADIIDAIVYNEFNHARMLYTFIQTAEKGAIVNIEVSAGYPFKEKWNLLDNLKFAAEDEANEAERIYPAFAQTADKEGFKDIAGLFRNLIEVEKEHKAMFTELYNQMKSGMLYKKASPVTWKCMDCGYQQTSKEAFQDCPLCHAKQGAALLHIPPYIAPSQAQLISKNAAKVKKASAPKASTAKSAASKPAAKAKSAAQSKSTAAKKTASKAAAPKAQSAGAAKTKSAVAKTKATAAKATAAKKPAASKASAAKKPASSVKTAASKPAPAKKATVTSAPKASAPAKKAAATKTRAQMSPAQKAATPKSKTPAKRTGSRTQTGI